MIGADEKPSIQARRRKHATLPATIGGGQKVEHEYERKGALCYLAAWDARRIAPSFSPVQSRPQAERN